MISLHFFRFPEKVSCSFSVLLKKCIRLILLNYDILSCNKFSIVSMIALASSNKEDTLITIIASTV